MATIYVNLTQAAGGTLTNGYGYGDDARDRATAASKTTPVATITRAEAVAVDGDTIVINDGTYTEATYVNVNIPNLTFNAENDHQVTLQQGGGQARVINVPSNLGTGLTIGKLVIDAEGLTGKSITTGSQAPNISFAGTKFINVGTQGVFQGTLIGSMSFTDGWSIEGAAVGSRMVYWQPGAAATFTMTDGEVTMDGATLTNGTGIIDCRPSITGCAATITDNIITVDNMGATSFRCLMTQGTQIVSIENNTVTNGTMTAGAIGIDVSRDATVSCTQAHVRNNTVSMAHDGTTTGTATFGIIVGEDNDTAVSNTITGIDVTGNTVTGTNHGIILGNVTGGKCYGNTITTSVLAQVGKNTTNCLFGGAYITQCSGAALRAKGGNGDVHGNNTHIVSTGFDGNSCQADTAGVVVSTGVIYQNNHIYSDVTIAKFVETDAGSDATFQYNNFYSTETLPADAFDYAATGSYGTLSAFETAIATASNNTETATAPTGGGIKWWTGANPIGSNGEPFADFDTDVGCLQSTSGPFHPTKL